MSNIGFTLEELDSFRWDPSLKPLANVVRFKDLFQRPTAIQHAVYAILAQMIQQGDVTWATSKRLSAKHRNSAGLSLCR
ncbi:hypothetical protein Ciccas_004634 [Cichlidogyrus casuarinus]|uniref:RNA helicase n=1 Tax=Cichlidogyrus casuarinus TaxID=1844966 RepID=A0ABD2QB09_9PLAT